MVWPLVVPTVTNLLLWNSNKIQQNLEAGYHPEKFFHLGSWEALYENLVGYEQDLKGSSDFSQGSAKIH